MTIVKVNGFDLSSRGIVRDITDSTIFRRDGLCGCLQATVEWGVSPDFMAPWLRRGAVLEVIEGGGVTWNGYVFDTEPNDNGMTIKADGLLVHGAKRVAIEHVLVEGEPVYSLTGDANAAVDTNALFFGLPWNRYGNDLGSVALEPGQKLMLNELLVQIAQAQGKFCEVGMSGEVRMIDEPTDVTWMTSPGSWFLSEADDQWLTHLFGLYVDSVDATIKLTSPPAADEDGAEQFGHSADVADLRARGGMLEAAALAEVEGRLSLVGGRLGWGGQVDLTPVNLWRAGASHASALSPRAGEVITLRGGFNNRGSTATMAGTTVTLGKVERRHSTRTATAYPLGMVPRDFEAAIAAAPAPGSDVSGAA